MKILFAHVHCSSLLYYMTNFNHISFNSTTEIHTSTTSIFHFIGIIIIPHYTLSPYYHKYLLHAHQKTAGKNLPAVSLNNTFLYLIQHLNNTLYRKLSRLINCNFRIFRIRKIYRKRHQLRNDCNYSKIWILFFNHSFSFPYCKRL